MYSLSDMAKALDRSTVYVKQLQARFDLPQSAGKEYSKAYLDLLRKIVALRILNVSEEALRKLWSLEKKILVLLHVDTDQSPTWFLDECGKRSHPRRRLLLTNYDTGTDIFLRHLQLGLPLRARERELFAAREMGEDVWLVLNNYLNAYERIRLGAVAQIKGVRAAASWANRLPQKLK